MYVSGLDTRHLTNGASSGDSYLDFKCPNAYFIEGNYIKYATGCFRAANLTANPNDTWNAGTYLRMIEMLYDWKRNPENLTQPYSEHQVNLYNIFKINFKSSQIQRMHTEFDGRTFTYTDGDGNVSSYTDVMEYC